MKFTFALITGLVALTGSADASPLALRGLVYDAEGITIQVDSGGCTDKNSISVTQLETFPAQVRFERKQDDFCEAYLPYGIQLKYTFAELGLPAGSKIVILNPVHKSTVIEVLR